MPPLERDTFWGERAVSRIPRFAKDPFYGQPKPPPEAPLLAATSRTAWRFALAVFCYGFFGALLYQLTGLGYAVIDLGISFLPPGIDILVGLVFLLTILVQAVSILQASFAILALGAPIFEELLKVGAALLLFWALSFRGENRGRPAMLGPRLLLAFVAAAAFGTWSAVVAGIASRFFLGWDLGLVMQFVVGGGAGLLILLAANLPGRPMVLAVRLALAIAAGGLFGWSEHFLYAEEDLASYMWRVAFHSGSAALSMVAYGVMERVPDTRARWLSTVPATLLHYANNGFVLFWAIIGGEAAATVWSVSISAGTWVAIPVVILAARPLRALAVRQLHRHLPWRSGAAPQPAMGPGRPAPPP